ncbi:hypothetical protein SLS62_003570 [Diatrype stigma]|uniref:Amidoligase enzyme n=1 Tax=Diatrype stigma TaxID=117547 RepID=A0AAN9YU96_9PEZI
MEAQKRLSRSGQSQRTFGCEFEWCVAFLWEDEVTPRSGGTAKLPPVIRVPKRIRDEIPSHAPKFKRHVYAFDYILLEIARTLDQNGLSVQTIGGPVSIKDLPQYQLAPFRGWKVKTDRTVQAPEEYPEFYWCPVEVTSPAELASDEAFGAVSKAIDLLTSKYWMRVNPSCGFHVHVGQGGHLLELRELRRVAGILWAADPLLACLHPPERRFNYWAQSIRERSILAHGAKADSYTTDEGDRTYHGLANVEKDLFQAVTAKAGEEIARTFSNLSLGDVLKGSSDTSYVCSRKRNGRRIFLPKYTMEDESRLKRVAEYGGDCAVLEPKVRSDPGVFYGVKELLSCQGWPVIPFLLEATRRPNYSFTAYTQNRLQNEYSRVRTVEFREAAGTMSGKWAATWARICVGIYDWAVHAPVDQYLAVLNNCDRAAKGGEYDVVDFLDQLGLSVESAIAEQRCNSQALWD